MFVTRGRPSAARAQAIRDAGYGDRQIPDIVLAFAVKTISNYANHVTHPEVDDAFAAFRVTEAA